MRNKFFLLLLSFWLFAQPLATAQDTADDAQAETIIANALTQYDTTADKSLLCRAQETVNHIAEHAHSAAQLQSCFNRICALQNNPNTRQLKKTNYGRFTDSGVESGFELMRDMLESAVSVCFNEFTDNPDYGHWYLEALVDLYFIGTTASLKNATANAIVSFLKGDIHHENLSVFLRDRSTEQALSLINHCQRINNSSEVPFKTVNQHLLFDKFNAEYRSGNLQQSIYCYNQAASEEQLYNKENMLRAKACIQYATGDYDANTIDELSQCIYNPHDICPELLLSKSLRQIEAEVDQHHDDFDLILSYIANSAQHINMGTIAYLSVVRSKLQSQQIISRLNHEVYNSMDHDAIKDFIEAKQLLLAANHNDDATEKYRLFLQSDSLEKKVFHQLSWQLSPIDHKPIRSLLKTSSQKQAFDRIQEITNAPLILTDQYFDDLQERTKLWNDLMLELGLPPAYSHSMRHIPTPHSLPPHQAAVEFACFHHFNYQVTDSVQYMAIVMVEEQKPKVVMLPQLSNIAFSDSSTYQSSQLYEAAWKPITDLLDDGSYTIYYSPAGLLHLVNHDALPTSSGSRLGDLHDLHLVSTTSTIFNTSHSTNEAINNDVLLCGNVTYDQRTTDEEASPKLQYRSPTPKATERFGLSPLDNSHLEVTNISELLLSNNIRPIVLETTEASETAIRKLSGNAPAILHISTHGFYIKENADLDNPMRRCGLLLAGANRAWTTGQSEPGQDDGILTAEEIAALDLSGCRMVVLSACETGLGDATDYEGVLGLQRAFKLAGVQTIVMSLWRVRDDVTALLMTRFYEHLLADKVTPHEAMRRAQRDVRRDFPDPHNWAAFVVLDG